MPSPSTRPNTTCFWSSQSALAHVRKNWQPLVSLPLLACALKSEDWQAASKCDHNAADAAVAVDVHGLPRCSVFQTLKCGTDVPVHRLLMSK